MIHGISAIKIPFPVPPDSAFLVDDIRLSFRLT
jgi:hypothetical protein